jgi:DNA-binding NarL/FixJ family response regulator
VNWHLRKSAQNNTSLKRSAGYLGKSINAVKSKTIREGLSLRRKNPKWSVSEIDIMQKLVAEGKSWDEISEFIKRTPSACRKKGSENGITREIKKEWRMSELRSLHENRCKGISFKEISFSLNRSEGAVRKRYSRYQKEKSCLN